MKTPLSAQEWEATWAPYSQVEYDAVLAQIRNEDIVLEIGAGDLRLAYQMAKIAKKVYAIENNPQVLYRGLKALGRSPDNLAPILADALTYTFPVGVTIAVLLMRHCTHFREYAQKLRTVGCRRLVTNARWHTGVEVTDLQAERISYLQAPMGWYACWCGAAGFKAGPASSWSDELDSIVTELEHCPQCRGLDEI